MSEAEQPGVDDEPGPVGGVAGDLLSALEADGELVDVGGFSIDAVQARKKLRDFQLADAHAYVLLLVEAAVLGGADPVQIRTSDGDVEIELGAIEFRADELEQLFAAVFINLDDVDAHELRRRRALQKLAFACNAAMRLEPRAIIVESGAQRLRLTAEHELGVLEPIAPDPDGGSPTPAATRVRIDRGLFEATAKAHEAELLHQHCRLSPVAIELDGARISAGPMAGLRVTLADGFTPSPRRVSEIELDGREIGKAALRYTDDAPAMVTLLCNGVLAEQFELGDAQRPGMPDFMAIVDVDLPKDLGQNKILRGPEFDRVMTAIWDVHDRIAPPEFGKAKTPVKLPRIKQGSPFVAALALSVCGIAAMLQGGDGMLMMGLALLSAGIGAAYFGLKQLREPHE